MRLAPASSESDQDQRPELPPPQPDGAHVAPAPDDAQNTMIEGSPRSKGSRSSVMSLAQLTAESLQKIHHDAFELLRFSETFPQGATSYSSQGEAGATMMALQSSSRSALLAMGKSSDGIASELRHMTALAAQADYEDRAQKAKEEAANELQSSHRRHKKHQEQGDPQAGPSQSRRRRKSSMTRLTCHECHRVETPQWRPGPDGPETLCNVCGLIYAKRKRKRKEASSCAVSWPS